MNKISINQKSVKYFNYFCFVVAMIAWAIASVSAILNEWLYTIILVQIVQLFIFFSFAATTLYALTDIQEIKKEVKE